MERNTATNTFRLGSIFGVTIVVLYLVRDLRVGHILDGLDVRHKISRAAFGAHFLIGAAASLLFLVRRFFTSWRTR